VSRISSIRLCNGAILTHEKSKSAIESNKDSVRNAMILGYRSDSKRQKVKSHAETEKLSSGQRILLQYCLLLVSIYRLKALGTVVGLLLTETEEYILIAQ
jgi:hypothetical protein